MNHPPQAQARNENFWRRRWADLKAAYRHINAVLESAGRHHIFLLAGGITFNIAVFLLPTILTMVFIISLFADAHNVMNVIESLIAQSLPPEASSRRLMLHVAAELQLVFDKTAKIGWIGIPALLWVSTTLFGSIRTGLNGVFEIRPKHFFLVHKLNDLGTMLLFMFIVLLSNLVTTVFTLIDSVGQHVIPPGMAEGFTYLTGQLASYVIAAAFFYFVFYFVPSRKQPRFVNFTGTLICTTLWIAARFLYDWYVGNLASYGKIYGAYAVLIVSAIWLYYSSLILLLSAEIARYWHEQRRKKSPETVKK